MAEVHAFKIYNLARHLKVELQITMVTFVFSVYTSLPVSMLRIKSNNRPATVLANSHANCTELPISGTSVTFSVAVSQPFTLMNALTIATTLAEKQNCFSSTNANADKEERNKSARNT